MLENIRKYTGLFIVVLVLIFVGLIFLGDNMSSGGPGSGPPVVKTKYETLSTKNLQNDGAAYLQLGQRVMQASAQGGSFQGFQDISQYLGVLGGGESSDSLKRFLVNRANFDRAIEAYGLHASQDDVNLYQREVLFTGRDGIFDKKSYDDFLNKGLKGLGNVNDLNAFTGDLLSFKKLTEVIGAGVQANEEAAKEEFISSAQTMSVSTLSLGLEDFKNDINPTEDEVKTFWQENQGRYLSDAKRKLTYIVAQPDYEAALEAQEKEESSTPDEEAAEDSEKSPAELAAAAEEPTLSPEAKNKLINKLGLEIEEGIWMILQQQVSEGAETAELEPLAEELGYEVKTTELISTAELPAEIRGAIRGSQGRTVEMEVADATVNPSNAMDSISEILGIGTDSWLLFRVDEATEPSELPFEEAMEDAKQDLITEKAEEELESALEAAREAIAKAQEEGKSLKEAAEEHKLKFAQHLNLTANSQLPNEPNTQDVFRLASQTKSGSLSKAEVFQPARNRGLFVFVEERQFVETDQNKASLDRAVSTQQQRLKYILVEHWFTAAYDEAEVEIMKTKS